MANSVEMYTPAKHHVGMILLWGMMVTGVAITLSVILESGMLWTVLTALLGFILTAGAAVGDWRHWQRSQKLHSLVRAAIGEVFRMPIPRYMVRLAAFERGSVLTVGLPRLVKITDPMKNSLPIGELEQAVSHALGRAYVRDMKRTRRTKVIVLTAQQAAEEEEPLTAREEAEQRLAVAAVDVLGEGAVVTVEWEETPEEPDYLVSVQITGFNGMNIAMSGRRNQAITRLRSRLPRGNFIPAADPNADLLEFHRAKPLPKLVVPPVEIAPLMRRDAEYQAFRIPLAIGANDTRAFWRPSVDPHTLIIGGTGGGKTICEHGIIQPLSQAAWRCWLVDGKRVEFTGYRNWPNVEFLAQSIEAQIRVIYLAHETMMQRYDMITAGKTTVAKLDPIVLVIDELTTLLELAEQVYDDVRVTGMPRKCPVLRWIGNILRLGRTAKMHVVIGMQRPDATIIDGEMRDNLACRISLGRLKSKEGSIMMWDDPAIGMQLPAIPGRSISLVDGAPTQVQSTYTANPDPNSKDYHAGMVAAAKPRHNVHSRKTVQKVEQRLTEEGDPMPLTWGDYLTAPILNAAGQQIQLNPISSEESAALKNLSNGHTGGDYDLQGINGFEEIDTIFDATAGLVHGRDVAQALRMFKTPPSAVLEESASERIPVVTGGTLGTVAVGEIEEGERILIEEVGEEIRVASIEPIEGTTTVIVQGYTEDGEAVSTEMEGTASVLRSLEIGETV